MSVFGEDVDKKMVKKLNERMKKLEDKIERLNRRLCKLEGTPVKEIKKDDDDACTIT